MAWRSHPSHANEAMDVDFMGSQTCEPVPAKSCSWVTGVTAWGLDRDYFFLLEDGKRLSHNPLSVLLLCVGKTEYHVIRVCPEGGLHECVGAGEGGLEQKGRQTLTTKARPSTPNLFTTCLNNKTYIPKP